MGSSNVLMARYVVEWESPDGSTSGRIWCHTQEEATAARQERRAQGYLAHGRRVGGRKPILEEDDD